MPPSKLVTKRWFKRPSCSDLQKKERKKKTLPRSNCVYNERSLSRPQPINLSLHVSRSHTQTFHNCSISNEPYNLTHSHTSKKVQTNKPNEELRRKKDSRVVIDDITTKATIKWDSRAYLSLDSATTHPARTSKIGKQKQSRFATRVITTPSAPWRSIWARQLRIKDTRNRKPKCVACKAECFTYKRM